MPLSRILPPRRRSMKSSTPTTSGWPSGTNAFTSRPSRILEPCRPDHTPRDKNRWNRLNPLSEAPSTARSAEHTVRRFRHSTAPVASATAFSHVGCVNIAANGASQISIAQAFPGCAIFATIGFPATNTRETSLRPTESPNLRTSSRLRRRYQAVWEIAKVQLRWRHSCYTGRIDPPREGQHANRRLHPHRQQRLADLGEFATVLADLR